MYGCVQKKKEKGSYIKKKNNRTQDEEEIMLISLLNASHNDFNLVDNDTCMTYK